MTNFLQGNDYGINIGHLKGGSSATAYGSGEVNVQEVDPDSALYSSPGSSKEDKEDEKEETWEWEANETE